MITFYKFNIQLKPHDTMIRWLYETFYKEKR